MTKLMIDFTKKVKSANTEHPRNSCEIDDSSEVEIDIFSTHGAPQTCQVSRFLITLPISRFSQDFSQFSTISENFSHFLLLRKTEPHNQFIIGKKVRKTFLLCNWLVGLMSQRKQVLLRFNCPIKVKCHVFWQVIQISQCLLQF